MLSLGLVGHDPTLGYKFRVAMTEGRKGPSEAQWCPTMRLRWG